MSDADAAELVRITMSLGIGLIISTILTGISLFLWNSYDGVWGWICVFLIVVAVLLFLATMAGFMGIAYVSLSGLLESTHLSVEVHMGK